MSLLHPLRARIDLTGEWRFAWSEHAHAIETIADVTAAGLGVRNCRVPGNFELDLEAAGILEDDAYLGTNIASRHRLESVHIWYFRRFDCRLPAGTTPLLVFDGLDCFATIHINGVQTGTSEDALVEHGFPLDCLRETGNEIVVHIRPVAEEARRFEYPPGAVAHPFAPESLYVRKAPHVFGWDIMPRAVSAGIWRPVGIEALPAARFETVFLETLTADEHEARLTLHFRLRLPPGAFEGYEVRLDANCCESSFATATRVFFEAGRVAVVVTDPLRWWPRDRGNQNLYDVTVSLTKDGLEQDRCLFRHGIRTVVLDRTSLTDEDGSGEFCFRVNGERIFIRGTNWVPADVYHSRDAGRLPRMLALAKDCGCNMIRCWGGNVYEAGTFFDFCDENGILVWQDFALACAVYPQDEDFQRAIADEARKVVRRLRSHASLVLWAGDNECDVAHDWYSRGSPARNAITRRVLPRILAEEDPGRPYLPSSPCVDEVAFAASRADLPEQHLWGPPRDAFFRSDYYTRSRCHFVSEIGYHGCPSARSLRKFLSPGKLWPPGNDEWWMHATSPIPGLDSFNHRIGMMCRQTFEMFGPYPDDPDEFAWRSQCLQAEANKAFIELFRGEKWRRTGILWWNLIDGWPQFSDAVVDHYFEKKLAYDFIMRAQQALIVMFRPPAGAKQEIVISNDTRTAASVKFRVHDLDSGQAIADGQQTAAGDAVTIASSIDHRGAPARFLVVDWESAHGSGRNHYLCGDPPFDALQYRRWIEAAYGPACFADRGL